MMESFYSNVRKLPGTLIYLLLSLILMYIAWEVLSDLFDWEGTLRQVVGYIPSNLINYWPILVIALLFAGMFLTKPFNLMAWFILLVMATSFFAPFLDRTGGWVNRVFNYGDWSVSSDYEPRTLYGGTVTFTRIGQVEEFYAKGEVQLLNQIFSQGSCLAISPISKFSLYSLEGNRKNFLTPRSGEKEWVMVEARRAGTCPNPQT